MSIQAEVVMVTPVMAQTWLQHNHHNRSLSPTVVKRYTDSIRAGQWVVNGQAIQFSDDGTLLDGQHRLAAVVAAATGAAMLVVRGVPAAARAVIDIGRKRTSGDVLVMGGCRNANSVAGAARLLWHYDTKTMHQTTNPLVGPGNQDILNLWKENPGLEYSSSVGRKAQRLVSPSVGTFTHYVFTRVGAEAADDFFEALVEGAALAKSSPILLVRNRLGDNRASKARLGTIEIAALLIKAWNHWRQGTHVKCLKWRTAKSEVGGGAEAFPTAI
jgi:hypothetical protein